MSRPPPIQLQRSPDSFVLSSSTATSPVRTRSSSPLHLHSDLPCPITTTILPLSILLTLIVAWSLQAFQADHGSMNHLSSLLQRRKGENELVDYMNRRHHDGEERKQGVVMANSHNDEMQKEPFTLAYSLSLASIEADTYLATPNYFLSHPLSNRTKHDHPEPVPIEQAEQTDEPDLYVGHTPLDLRREKTLRSVYLDRIWEILERNNQGRGRRGAAGSGSSVSESLDSDSLSSFDNDDKHDPNESDKQPKRGIRGKKEWDWNGLFTEQGEKDRTLLFYIDVKHNKKAGEIMYPYLLKALEPFRKAGYLTTFHRSSTPGSSITDGHMTLGPLTIIGTGDTPLLSVLQERERIIFFDAPLLHLARPVVFPDPETGVMKTVDWDPTFAPVASGKFPLQAYISQIIGLICPLEWFESIPYPHRRPSPSSSSSSSSFSIEGSVSTVREDIRLAHSKGIQARWWGVIGWPRSVRWRMWRRLKTLGADWINADQLREVRRFLRAYEEIERGKGGKGGKGGKEGKVMEKDPPSLLPPPSSLPGPVRVLFDHTIRHAIPLSFFLQILLVGYGEYQDRHLQVKYTDVDYKVFGDAVRCLWTGCGRGEDGLASGWLGGGIGEATYRYTPLLAIILSPIWLLPDPLGAFSGKLLFSAVSSFIIPPLLMGQYLNAPATLTHLIWTLNPMILNINTRGSSESLLAALVLASLVLVKRRSMGWAAMVWAFSVHWKVYPIIYAAPILMQLQKMDQGRFWTWNKIRFGLVSAGTFFVLSVSCWLIWGQPFLEHTYLYHVGRLDHRHNFSPYFYPIYQSMFGNAIIDPGSQNLSSRLYRAVDHPLFAFLPQMVATGAAGLILANKTTLEFAFFVQTVLFVTFNKVCTSQYFLWYLFFLPAIVPRLQLSKSAGFTLLGGWIAAQALWLSTAYKLEFLAQNVYLSLWTAGLGFLATNTWCIIRLIKAYK